MKSDKIVDIEFFRNEMVNYEYDCEFEHEIYYLLYLLYLNKMNTPFNVVDDFFDVFREIIRNEFGLNYDNPNIEIIENNYVGVHLNRRLYNTGPSDMPMYRIVYTSNNPVYNISTYSPSFRDGNVLTTYPKYKTYKIAKPKMICDMLVGYDVIDRKSFNKLYIDLFK